MNAYIYNAALWCPDCIAKLKAGFTELEPCKPGFFLPEIEGRIKSGEHSLLPDGYVLDASGHICREVKYAPLTCPGDPDDEHTFDSDDYPKGPYTDGGGESDTIQTCDGCHCLLENPLTSDGQRNAIDMVLDNLDRKERHINKEFWREVFDFYPEILDDVKDYIKERLTQ